jgi:hypothetical protein
MSDDTSLAHRAYRTPAAIRAAEFAMRSALLARVVGDDIQAAIHAVTQQPDRGAATAEAEYNSLTQPQQLHLGETVTAELRQHVIMAAAGLRSTARLLDIDDRDLNPDYVALVAAMLWFGAEPNHYLYDPTQADAA